MIDIQLLRADIDAVAKRLSTRGYTLDVAGFRVFEQFKLQPPQRLFKPER